MEITTGTRFNHYEVLTALGAGGMGEVYRAKDPRLNREVAIKVLPADFANDADRLKRFEQEARATSALNHPNILTIYDIGNYEGVPFIVAELLEGEELRAQLEQGALPVRKAIEYAQQVAAGLAAAHEKGVVHRDLKPENLFLTKDGRLKILDFGLAKLKPQKLEGAAVEDAPTLKPLTSPGVVMGTVGYMSPEQVRGHETDHRSDIFSLGVILHEMLSGQRAFTGDSVVELMNAILKDEPPELSETNAKISPQLDKIVRHCLEKKPEQRFQTASDLGFALSTLTTPSGSRPGSQLDTATALPTLPESFAVSTGGRFGNARLAWVAVAVAVLVVLALLPFAIAHLSQSPPEVRAVRSFILPPEKSSFDFGGRSGATVVVSPDGRRLAFVATAQGNRLLWVRSLDAISAQSLAGTEGAMTPFWSPDSRSIGFFADGKLKRIEAAGGPALTLCEAPGGRGGTWNRAGVIVFAPNFRGGLQRVSASGGASSVVSKLDEARGETTHRWPYFLPDGEHFLYLSATGPALDVGGAAAICVASLASQEGKLLLPADSNAVHAEGYLLFLRERTLMAQPFDTKRLATTGDAFPIAEQVQSTLRGTGIFSVSEGVLAYQTGSGVSGSQLSWFDRIGKPLGMLGDLALYNNLCLSPDGKRATVAITDPQTRGEDIWLYEVARGLRTRFTFDPADERQQAWSPDGSRIVFSSNRKGRFDLYQKVASGAGNEELLLESNLDKFPNSFSPDGRFLLYHAFDPKTRSDVWVLPLEGGQTPFPFLQTEFNELRGQFSPDGRWVAYQSDESRRDEIYVAPFPGPGGKRQISTTGGQQPIWPGKEIFYLSPDNKLMATEVNVKGATLEVVVVRPLFEISPSGAAYAYAVTAEGQRFLVNTAEEQKASAPITLVLNWTADLKR